MSVIAWDGKTLVADSQLTFGEARLTAQKLSRLGDGSIVGVAGNARGELFLAYLRGERTRPPKMEGVEAIVVKPDGTVLLYAETPVAEHVTSRQVAIGSGGLAAMVAMLLGHEAADAVSAVCEVHTACSHPIQRMDIERTNDGA